MSRAAETPSAPMQTAQQRRRTALCGHRNHLARELRSIAQQRQPRGRQTGLQIERSIDAWKANPFRASGVSTPSPLKSALRARQVSNTQIGSLIPQAALHIARYLVSHHPIDCSAYWNILILRFWTAPGRCAMLLVTGLMRIPDECVRPAREQDCGLIAGPHGIPFTNTCSECALEATVAEEL